jgi:hypothetical protein
MHYRLLVSIEVIEFIERLPGRTRGALRRAIHAIGRDPLGRSDALDYDAIGRRIQIAVVGDYALGLWAMSVQEIKEQLAALPRTEQDEVIASSPNLMEGFSGYSTGVGKG